MLLLPVALPDSEGLRAGEGLALALGLALCGSVTLLLLVRLCAPGVVEAQGEAPSVPAALALAARNKEGEALVLALPSASKEGEALEVPPGRLGEPVPWAGEGVREAVAAAVPAGEALGGPALGVEPGGGEGVGWSGEDEGVCEGGSVGVGGAVASGETLALALAVTVALLAAEGVGSTGEGEGESEAPLLRVAHSVDAAETVAALLELALPGLPVAAPEAVVQGEAVKVPEAVLLSVPAALRAPLPPPPPPLLTLGLGERLGEAVGEGEPEPLPLPRGLRLCDPVALALRERAEEAVPAGALALAVARMLCEPLRAAVGVSVREGVGVGEPVAAPAVPLGEREARAQRVALALGVTPPPGLPVAGCAEGEPAALLGEAPLALGGALREALALSVPPPSAAAALSVGVLRADRLIVTAWQAVGEAEAAGEALALLPRASEALAAALGEGAALALGAATLAVA